MAVFVFQVRSSPRKKGGKRPKEEEQQIYFSSHAARMCVYFLFFLRLFNASQRRFSDIFETFFPLSFFGGQTCIISSLNDVKSACPENPSLTDSSSSNKRAFHWSPIRVRRIFCLSLAKDKKYRLLAEYFRVHSPFCCLLLV